MSVLTFITNWYYGAAEFRSVSRNLEQEMRFEFSVWRCVCVSVMLYEWRTVSDKNYPLISSYRRASECRLRYSPSKPSHSTLLPLGNCAWIWHSTGSWRIAICTCVVLLPFFAKWSVQSSTTPITTPQLLRASSEGMNNIMTCDNEINVHCGRSLQVPLVQPQLNLPGVN